MAALVADKKGQLKIHLYIQMFFKIGVLKKFAIFTGKHLLRFFLIKLQDFRPATLLERDSNAGENM